MNPAGGAPALGRRTYQKGLQTIVWKADDENDDDLGYDVLYRREGETTWTTLRRGLSDADPRLGHDDGAHRHVLREGRRLGRAVQSGRRRALTGELESSAFDIDNTPPVITVQSVRSEGGRTRRSPST